MYYQHAGNKSVNTDAWWASDAARLLVSGAGYLNVIRQPIPLRSSLTPVTRSPALVGNGKHVHFTSNDFVSHRVGKCLRW